MLQLYGHHVRQEQTLEKLQITRQKDHRMEETPWAPTLMLGGWAQALHVTHDR